MKIVACTIIMFDTCYMAFNEIVDHFLKRKANWLYQNLDFIGLKETDSLKQSVQE